MLRGIVWKEHDHGKASEELREIMIHLKDEDEREVPPRRHGPCHVDSPTLTWSESFSIANRCVSLSTPSNISLDVLTLPHALKSILVTGGLGSGLAAAVEVSIEHRIDAVIDR